MKRILLIFLTLLLVCSAVAGYMYISQTSPASMAALRVKAEQGNAEAQAYMGTAYRYGMGVKKDYAEALKWYQKSANQGYVDAKINIGWMYEHGTGVPQDYVEAYMWYKLANPEKEHASIASEMTPEQIAEGKRRAAAWKPVAAPAARPAPAVYPVTVLGVVPAIPAPAAAPPGKP